MGLKLIVDSLDKVDEKVKHLYVEDGDNFILDVLGVTSHPSVTALKSTLTKERDARKVSDKALKEIEELTDGLDLEKLKGIDPDKYNSTLKNLEKLEKDEKKRNKQKLKDKEQWEKLEQQLQDDFDVKVTDLKTTHGAEITVFQDKLDEVSKKKDEKIDLMMVSLEKELKEKEIISAISDAKGNRIILMPHIERYVKIVQSDSGNFAARVVDKNGTVRINDEGDPLTISDFVGELKEKKEFKGEGIFEKTKKTGGSGSEGNQGGDDNDADNPFSKDSFNLTEQGILFKKDRAEYKRLQALAEKEKEKDK